MKKRNIAGKFLAVVALLVALVTVLSSCTYIRILQLLNERTANQTTHAEVDFETLTYERPDFDALKEQIAAAQKMVKDKANAYDLVVAYLDVNDAFTNAQSQNTLMQILHDRDVTNEENAAELEWIAEQIADVQGGVAKLNRDIAHSEYCELMFGELSEEELKEIDMQADAMDEEYTALQAEITALCNEYDALCAEMEDVDLFIEEAGAVYLELIPLYRRVAEKFEAEGVADYWYRYGYGRSYSPEDGLAFDRGVKDVIGDLEAEVLDSFTQYEFQLLSLTLSEPGLLEKAQPKILAYFDELKDDGDLGAQNKLGTLDMKTTYEYMSRNHLCDISDPDEKRSPNVYTTYLAGPCVPFLFLTKDGSIQDVDTFIHEFGHFNAFYYNGETMDIDIAEVQSQGNEFLFLPYYAELIGERPAAAYEKYKWLLSLDAITQGCLLDEFQQAVFASEETWTVETLCETFGELAESYGMSPEDYAYPLEALWVFIPHTIHTPFYYISYAVSLFPALEIGAFAKAAREEAIVSYTAVVLKDDGTRTFEELLEEAGLTSPFAEESKDVLTMYVHGILYGPEDENEEPDASPSES